MADERDPEVSQRYRELGAEEPPRQLDEAILAASRRRWRWGLPLAAAAVIVLSVAVTWHMQVEAPDADDYAASAPAPAGEKGAHPPARPDASVAMRAPSEKREAPAAPSTRQQASTPAAEIAASRAEPRMRESAPVAGGRTSEAMIAKQLAEESPEKFLQRIAELRRQGLHEDADRALEAFRKRYPEYKLPESVLKK